MSFEDIMYQQAGIPHVNEDNADEMRAKREEEERRKLLKNKNSGLGIIEALLIIAIFTLFCFAMISDFSAAYLK